MARWSNSLCKALFAFLESYASGCSGFVQPSIQSGLNHTFFLLLAGTLGVLFLGILSLGLDWWFRSTIHDCLESDLRGGSSFFIYAFG